MADDLASFNKQIGALPIKLKRQLAGAIQVEADRLAAAIKAAAPVFPLGCCSSFLRFYRSGWTPDDRGLVSAIPVCLPAISREPLARQHRPTSTRDFVRPFRGRDSAPPAIVQR